MNLIAKVAAFLILLSLFAIAEAENISCDAAITISDNQVTVKLSGIADKETSYQIRKTADISNNGYVTEEEARTSLSSTKVIFGFDLDKQNFLNVDGLILKIDSKLDEFPNLPGEAMSANPVTLKSQYATDANAARGYFTSGKHRVTFNFQTGGKVTFTLELPSGLDEKNITFSKGKQDVANLKKITGELDPDEPLTVSFAVPSASTSASSSADEKSRVTPGFEPLLSLLALISTAYIFGKRML